MNRVPLPGVAGASPGRQRGEALPDLAGRIGPNAVTRVAQALVRHGGHALAAEVFVLAGLGHAIARPPVDMVPEEDACRLHRALRDRLGPAAPELAREAGIATADYLLERRIPRPVQWLLKGLPATWAAHVLLAAIGRHAWTFAGSGRFTARPARGAGSTRHVLEIRDNPLCRGLHADAPACDYYAATFERLFQALVHPRSRVVEVACEARGDAACRFEVGWESRRR